MEKKPKRLKEPNLYRMGYLTDLEGVVLQNKGELHGPRKIYPLGRCECNTHKSFFDFSLYADTSLRSAFKHAQRIPL